jgi:uncharacterized protein (TIGR02996 family)
MTTEDDFQAMLDANPNDHDTRRIFADWLEERGDTRAEGYRALGAKRKHPVGNGGEKWPYEWWREDEPSNYSEDLPDDWLAAIQGAGRDYKPAGALESKDFATRSAAEDSAALAFAALPAARRAELLAVPAEASR